MTPSSRDRISVDLRGLKPALVAQAGAQGMSPSAFVRSILAAALGSCDGDRLTDPAAPATDARVRLCLRMRRSDADSTRRAAREAGLALGDFVATMTHRPAHGDASNPTATLATLTASCAELATLSRNLHHLTTLLRQGSVRAAQEYREMLDTLDADVRAHLDLATSLVTQLRPLIRLAS